MSTSDGCYPWQAGGCEWTIQFLWSWVSPFGRIDVIMLALILLYLFVVVIHVYCYYVARRNRGMDRSAARALAAVLNINLGNLKSIVITAPYLGLVGTCEGILNAFSRVSGERHAVMVMITTRIALALIPTAASIPVAVLAACSYSYLRTRMDLLETDALQEGRQRGLHLRGPSRFPRAKHFSGLSAFGPLAAAGLAVLIPAYLTFTSSQSRGFYVEMPSDRCEFDVVDQLIVLHITDTDKLLLNQEEEDWDRLANRLSAIYGRRKYRTLYLLADPGVSFKTVAEAVDTVENAPTDIQVQLLTPKSNADCLKPVVSSSGHHALK